MMERKTYMRQENLRRAQAMDAQENDARDLALLNNIAQRQMLRAQQEVSMIDGSNPLQRNEAPGLFDTERACADLRDLDDIQDNKLRLMATAMILENARQFSDYEQSMRSTEKGSPEMLLVRARAWHTAAPQSVLSGKNIELHKGSGGDYLIGRITDGNRNHHFVVVYPVAHQDAEKSNFLKVSKPTLSSDVITWTETGYGNAINRSFGDKLAHFDEVVISSFGRTVCSRIPESVTMDEDLHRKLGFQKARIPRAAQTDKNEAADTPTPEAKDTQKVAPSLPRMGM